MNKQSKESKAIEEEFCDDEIPQKDENGIDIVLKSSDKTLTAKIACP